MRIADLQMVEVSGLVVDQIDLDSTHLRLELASSDWAMTVFVHMDSREPVPQFKDAFVRARGLLSVRSDLDPEKVKLELWVTQPSAINVNSWLAEEPRFASPVVDVDKLQTIGTNLLVRVQGIVHAQEPGESLTLWDKTGQVKLLTHQKQLLPIGSGVEAIGFADTDGPEWLLRKSLYRPWGQPSAVSPDPSRRGLPRLRLAAQIRELSPQDAARPYPAQVQGIVTWSSSATNFFFVQDGSGGVKVFVPRSGAIKIPGLGSEVIVSGETAPGDFVPNLNASAVRLVGGNKELPSAQSLSLEQLRTGHDYAQWIEIRAYVRSLRQEGSFIRLALTTSGGEFVARVVTKEPSLPPWAGAVVKVCGVCDVRANERRQLSNIRLWVPSEQYVRIEEQVPVDLFTTRRQTIGSLRQFSPVNNLNHRVQVSGVVLLHRPGEFFYLQDGQDRLLVLSRQATPLSAGERVDVVGFPGHSGWRLVLREAAFRSAGLGGAPRPIVLNQSEGAQQNLDGALVHIEGVLLDLLRKNDETHLQIQAGRSVFEAVLKTPLRVRCPSWELGSVVGLTGVYQVKSDEFQQPQSFVLQLRSPQDVLIVRRPPWWTAGRVLAALCVAAGLIIFTVGSSALLARKNRLLSHAQQDLRRANETLETRVQERTRELECKIEEQKRSEQALHESHTRLVEVSRQAGMAEVATSVLHNVGNVLNSVNVSATVVANQVKASKSRSLGRVVELLRAHPTDLGHFITADPRGKQLPAYLEELATLLGQERDLLLQEIDSLRRNLEHIKDVVSMQQSYARVSGLTERVKVADLIEDALRMNLPALARHRIDLIREYQASLPEITVDKNKVLQILVNLIRNAKYACQETGRSDKQITVRANEGQGRILISVIDNGVGIAPENLTRIFQHGFTTRPQGHGFGLHSGALAARDLGGALTAQSAGPGLGATFTLELPLQPVIQKEVPPAVVSSTAGHLFADTPLLVPEPPVHSAVAKA